MNYPDIDPVIFSIGPIAIRWYGLAYVVAFVVCYTLGRKRLATHSNFTVQQWNDLLFWGIVGSLLGGRIGFVFFYGFERFIADPLWAFRVWEGGMSFHGGALGVAIAIFMWCKIQKTTFFSVTDFIVPVVPIGIGIGRLGNFANSELPGRVTDSFLGVHFPCDAVAQLNPTCVGVYEELTRHVSSLYQSFVTGVFVFGLLWWFSSKPRERGLVSGLFILLYGIGRCFTEIFREPDVELGFIVGNWLTMGQLLSIPMILIGGTLLIPRVNKFLTQRFRTVKQYLELLQKILDEGVPKEDRTGTGTLSVFGHQFRCDLSEGFPLVTTKKMFVRGIVHELLWLLSGSSNIRYLQENNVHIWDEWADENGDLGPVYGYQWRSWPCADGKFIDQISQVIDSIRTNPSSRRHLVSAWNVEYLDKMALPPCHTFFQFYVANNKLSCQLYQRSADVFLGVPFNIASYSLLTHMVAQVTNFEPGEFIHTFGDAHLYVNHLEQTRAQLKREPLKLPRLELNPAVTDLYEFQHQDIRIEDYVSHGILKAEISV